MRDPGPVLHDEQGARRALVKLDAEQGLLAAERQGLRAAPDPAPEPADERERLPAKRHVPAEQVPDRGARGRHPLVVAPDDPVELLRHPRRAPRLPVREREPADSRDGRVRIALSEVPQPAGISGSVVVKEGDDLSRCQGGTGITPAGQALGLAVLYHRHVRQDGDQPLVERGVVVDDDDRLCGRQRLDAHRVDRGADVIPAVLGIDADHHGDAWAWCHGASPCCAPS